MCGAALHLEANSGALSIQWRKAEGGSRALRSRALRGRSADAQLLRVGMDLVRRWRRTGSVDRRALRSLLPEASAFTTACWLAAATIPCGSTRTYAQLAVLAGRRGAARAAASAMARNPLPPLIPCHRVVARDGIGGFCGIAQRARQHWAIRLKQALLLYERAHDPYALTPRLGARFESHLKGVTHESHDGRNGVCRARHRRVFR
jgi:O-6-methylguanine DNA methyltransferase